MKKIIIAFLLLTSIAATAQTITDPTYWDRKQLYANWLFDYDTVRINRLHIDNQTGIDSTGRIFRYMGTTPGNGKLLIGTGAGFAIGDLSSTDGSVTFTPGAGTLDLSINVTGGDVGGLEQDLVLFGSASGGIEQDTDFVYTSNYLGTGIGKGIELTDDTLPYIYLKADDPWASEIALQGNSNIRWRSEAGASHWLMEYDNADGSLGIHNNTSSQHFDLYAGSAVNIYSDRLVKIYDSYEGNSIEIDSNNIRIQVDSLWTSARFVGIGTEIPMYNLDINEDGRVEIIGTGYGTAKTVFGARYANGTYASPSAVTTGQDMGEFGVAGYKASAFSTSATAYMKGISTENWTDAATGTKLEFAVNPNTTAGSSVAMTIDQDRNVQFERKIEEYNNAAPTNGQVLIGNTGTATFDAATLTAGSGVTITNGAGTITIAETNEAATTYTPTGTAITNITTIGTVYGQYYRDGNMCHVFIYTTATVTSGSVLTELSFTLPISSDLTNSYDAFGQGTALSSANANGFPGRVYGSAVNNNVVFAYRPTSTASLELNLAFTYEIK